MYENNIDEALEFIKKYAPFISVNWGETLRGENNNCIPANWISIYPVISMFSYPHGCFLSQAKLAAYAGLRKEIIPDTVQRLLDTGWIKFGEYKKRKTLIPTRNYLSGEQASKWVIIGRELLETGIWAAMEQTRQVFYTIMQAWCTHISFYDPELAFDVHGNFDRSIARDCEPFYNCNKEYRVCDCNYLPLSRYNPSKFIDAAQRSLGKQISSKTFQRAKDYFIQNRLMFYDRETDAFIFPRKPGYEFGKFLGRLERIDLELESHKVSYAAKRARYAAMFSNKVKEPIFQQRQPTDQPTDQPTGTDF